MLKARRQAVVAVTVAITATALVAAGAIGQQHEHSPYAHTQSSEVPSLTPDEVTALRDGEGMGLARPAELNRYPGPLHVLELRDDLALTDDQHARINDIFDDMKSAARDLGAAILDAEQHLNMRFANRHIDDLSLREATAEIAEMQGSLRFIHLEAHLRTTEVLTPEQVESYHRLRGYDGAR